METSTMDGSHMVASGGSSAGFIGFLSTLLYRGCALGFGLTMVVGALLYFKQESLLYLPEIGGIPRRPEDNPRRYRSPGESGIPFTSHMITCADGVRIHAWLLNRGPTKPTLVFFHGNAGNIGLRLPNAIQMYQYLDVNVFMVEYRGYGNSESVKPTEQGLKLDAEAALQFLATDRRDVVDINKVFIFGRSLGGAVTFHVAQYAERNKIPLAGVIVENTFLSIPDMVNHLMPLIAPLKVLILRMGWMSKEIVPKLRLPIFYLAGAMDELVPHFHMQHLHKTSQSSRLVRMHIIPDGTHNETWLQGGQVYWSKMKEFIAEALALPQGDDDKQACDSNAATANKSNNNNGMDRGVDNTPKAIPTMSSNLYGMLGDVMGSSGDINNNYDSSSKKEI